MNSKKKKLLIIFSICLNIGFLIVTGYTVVRYKLPYHHHKSRYSSHVRLFEGLDLSESQKKELDRLIDDYVSASREVRLRSYREDIRTYTLLEKPIQPGRDILDAHLKVVQAVESDKEEVKFRHLLDVKRVLTADQARRFFPALAEKKRKRASKFKEKP
ncbi:MAG: periplasmic heavy metal sensor [Proteobacteria bacterium]|nr:periplasmic heavy metal sensor [Pseudomonadota bacterium]